MILIDGRESSLCLSNFANLEEVLTTIITEEKLEERIITDVFVDKEAFSELYPHQAEDIPTEDFSHLELKTISLNQMATSVIVELPKVIDIMAKGSHRIADLLRQADLAEGLEVMRDFILVSRDFLSTTHVLREHYSGKRSKEMDKLSETLASLLGEIADVMVNEDWVLVADLLEYEYLPACEGWRAILDELSDAIKAASAE